MGILDCVILDFMAPFRLAVKDKAPPLELPDHLNRRHARQFGHAATDTGILASKATPAGITVFNASGRGSP